MSENGQNGSNGQNGNGQHAESPLDGDLNDLTEWVQAARRGLRRDVAALLDHLDGGELFVPLARPVQGVQHGEELELDDDLTITPHMLADDEGNLYCALFTRADILEPLIEQLGWTTDGEPLEYCSLPAKVGLDLAVQVVDETRVLALVVNPMHESELMLRRIELASIVNGQPVPLVGYVKQIPVQDFEKTLIAEAGDPPPPEFVAALERCLGELDDSIGDYEILRTFNADRDLEPHLTLSLKPKHSDIDFQAVTDRLIAALSETLPPPGYIDIVFDRTQA